MTTVSDPRILVILNAPRIEKVSGLKNITQRLSVAINRIIQDDSTYQKSLFEFVSFVDGHVPEISSLKEYANSIRFDYVLFFYVGEVHFEGGNLYIREVNSKATKLGSFFNFTKFSEGFINLYSFLEFSRFFHDGLSSDDGPTVESRLVMRKYEGGATYFDDFLELNRFVPSYEFPQLLSYVTGNIRQDTHESNLSDKRSIASFVEARRVWDDDPANLGSENAGSREDGIQALRAAMFRHQTATEARALLKYFALCDPEENVRNAAANVLAGYEKKRLSIPNSIVKSDLLKESFLGTLCQVPAGSFVIGSDLIDDPFSLAEERPKHTLYIDDFEIMKSPLSEFYWAAYNREIGTSEVFEGQSKLRPATRISWYEAMAFSAWLTHEMWREGTLPSDQEIRLPSEAEWEKAARGEGGRIYPWGDEFVAGRCNYRKCNMGDVVEFASYSPEGDSPYGVSDMAGNAWDWTISLWGRGGAKPDFPYPYNKLDGREDIFAGPDVRRVVRGGAYYYFDYCLRCATRNLMFPNTRHSGGAVRLIKTKERLLPI